MGYFFFFLHMPILFSHILIQNCLSPYTWWHFRFNTYPVHTFTFLHYLQLEYKLSSVHVSKMTLRVICLLFPKKNKIKHTAVSFFGPFIRIYHIQYFKTNFFLVVNKVIMK